MKSIILFFTLLLSLISFSQIPNYVPSNGLVGYWPFTGNANDLSGNNNNGAVNGATLTTDRFGNVNQAYSFDGSSNRIQINPNNPFQNNTSISVWFYSSNITGGPFVHIGQDNGSNPYCDGYDIGKGGSTLNNQGNDLISGFSCVGYYDSNVSGPNGQWNHAVLVKLNAQILIYLNGILISTQNTSTSVAASQFIFFASTSSGFSTMFNGKLDDIGIWNRALTQQEITALYTSTSGTVSALNCNGFTQTGNLFSGQVAANVSVTVPYTGGNAGFYAGQSIASTGVSGLTATRTSGTLANGNGTVSYTITGTPSAVGNATFALNIGGQACSFTLTVQSFATLSINTNDTICNGISTMLTANVANAGTSCVAPGLSGTLTNGLVGYWPFCGNANDLSGNANNGTVNGATLTTDRFGAANQAYSFDGVNDYVMVGNSNNLNSISSVSVSGWLNAAQLGGVRGLVSKWNQNGNPCYNFSTSVDGMNNNFVGATSQYPSTVLVSSNSLSVSNWFYFTFTHDQNVGGKIYLNGALVGTNNTTGSICQSATDLYFGAQWNVSSLWRFFNGKLDDIAIYNRAITQQV